MIQVLEINIKIKTILTIPIWFLITVVLPVFGLTSISYAQEGKWTIELSSGCRSEIFESTDHTDFELKTGRRLGFPQIEMSVWYGWKDYFSLESGLAFVPYHSNWAYGFDDDSKTMYITKHPLYSALQIPLRGRFAVPIKDNFYFFSSTGIVLQFPLQSKFPNAWIQEIDPYQYFSGEITNSWEKIKYTLRVSSPMCGINILLNMKAGFMYRFDVGLGLSVFGEYYKGTRTMAEIVGFNSIQSNQNPIPSNTYSHYKTKGDYWHTGIGISYSFSHSKKTKLPKDI